MTDKLPPETPIESDELESTEAYKIGHGKPPKATQWKKGARSPNPRGRPLKSTTIVTDIKKLFEEKLHRKISVTRDGRQITMSRLELGIEQLLNRFAKGDRYATKDLIALGALLGVDFSGALRAAMAALTPDHQRIIDAYIKRIGVPDNVVEKKRVFAPDDLLDGDVEKRR